MAYEAKKKGGLGKKAATSRKGSAKKAPGSRKRRKAIFAFSHPMVLVNLADTGKVTTVYVGKDPKKTTKYSVKGGDYIGLDIDPD